MAAARPIVTTTLMAGARAIAALMARISHDEQYASEFSKALADGDARKFETLGKQAGVAAAYSPEPEVAGAPAVARLQFCVTIRGKRFCISF